MAGINAAMSTAKLGRYAAFTVAYSVVLVLLLLGVLPEEVGLAFVVVFALPLLWSWGAYQAHTQFNGALDDVERQRWRIAFYLVPPSMAAYWWRYVRD